jgi:hypothetical protein
MSLLTGWQQQQQQQQQQHQHQRLHHSGLVWSGLTGKGDLTAKLSN